MTNNSDCYRGSALTRKGQQSWWVLYPAWIWLQPINVYVDGLGDIMEHQFKNNHGAPQGMRADFSLRPVFSSARSSDAIIYMQHCNHH